jgi:hypothetical protein
MAGTTSKAPTTFVDGINSAMQDIAGAMSAPDADLHFGTEMIKVMGTFLQSQHQRSAGGQGQGQPAPAGPSSPPPGRGPGGGPPGPPPSGAGGGKPPGQSVPGGPAGGGAANPQMQSSQPPSGPTPPGSGPTPGLTPNPDEMRRVLQEVAGQ